MNHATDPYATTKDTTSPIASTIHPWPSICETPIGFSPFPLTDCRNVYPVATAIVGMDKKNENSRADARDIRATCPPAIVDIDRDVPGNTAERIWHAPTQTDCPRLISSIFHTQIPSCAAPGPAASARAFAASTIHIMIPPISSEIPIIFKLSRFFPMTLVSRYAGIAVTT